MAVIIGDYQYDDLVLGICRATVVDKTKTSYADIPATITYRGQTYEVRNLKFCFNGCSNLVTPPSLPPEVGSMEFCFYGCSSMTTPPVIPNGVNNLSNCFYGCSSMATAPDLSPTATSTIYPLNLNKCFSGCSSITQAPTIPSHTTNMSYCFSRCESLTTAPEIPNNVTSLNYCFYKCTSLTTPPVLQNGTNFVDMRNCFEDCASLVTPPEIPSQNANMANCFKGCSSLAGNMVVSNTDSNYNMFEGTVNDIYIINKPGTSAVETNWKTVASVGGANIHYEADDNPLPSLSFTATRVGSSSSEIPSEGGTYAFIKATAIVYDTYLPNGWMMSYNSDSEIITMDEVVQQSVSWTRDSVGNVYTLKAWISPIDASKHTFTLQVSDSVKNENNVIKATKLSEIVSRFITKSYKLVDYYHDPNTDTEGMAIGKFATSANLFDVDMPTIFRDTTTCQDMDQTEINNFVNELDVHVETSGGYITEMGTKDGWDYIKYSNGTIDAYTIKTWSTSNYTTYSSFSAYNTGDVALPFTMANSTYYVNSNWIVGSGHSITGSNNYANTTTKVVCYCLSSATGTQNCKVSIHVHGQLA